MNFDHWVRRAARFRENLTASLNRLPETKLVAGLVALWAVWRILTLHFIEKSGDAVWKWRFLRFYAETGVWFPPAPDHHQGRWAINLPVYGLMELFGTGVWVYYVFPLFTSLATGLLLYYLGRKLKNQAAGAAAFVLALLFPLIVRESTQFLPMLPAAMFVLAALALTIRHFESPKWYFLPLAGLLVGLAYGCKVTSMYWAAAIGLFLVFFDTGRKPLFRIGPVRVGSDALLFSAGVLGLLAVETLLLNRFFGVRFGQLQMIAGAHLANRQNPEYLNLAGYLCSFVRPLDVSGKYFDFLPTLLVIAGGMGSAILLLLEKPPRVAVRFVAFAFIAVYVFHSYVVYKVFPFLHPEKAHGRYHLILGALALVLLAISSGAWGKFLRRRLPARAAAAVPAVFYGVLLVVMLIRAGNAWKNGDHPVALLRVDRVLAQADRDMLPVLLHIDKVDQLTPEGGMASSDEKYGELYRAFWGPVEQLPEERHVHRLLTDENGATLEYLWGPPPPAGRLVRCVVVSEQTAEIRSVSLRPAPAPPLR